MVPVEVEQASQQLLEVPTIWQEGAAQPQATPYLLLEALVLPLEVLKVARVGRCPPLKALIQGTAFYFG